MWAYLSEMREVIQAIADGKSVEEHNPKTGKWEVTDNPGLTSKRYVRIAKKHRTKGINNGTPTHTLRFQN